MTDNDYPIYADDGTKFCVRTKDENGELVVEGPKGKKLTVDSFIEQVYNPHTSNARRNKIRKR